VTPPRSRGSTLRRWLIALLLLAALAWGLGEMRSDRDPKPEMGVGDLRQTEEPAAVEQAASETGAGPRPRPEAGSSRAGSAPEDAAVGDPGESEADR
jgi:hypothetical protein